MNDHADKDWLTEAEDQARGMQMLVGAMCLVGFLALAALLGLVGADWWSGHDTMVTLIAQLRTALCRECL
jgi:hypothetical protein